MSTETHWTKQLWAQSLLRAHRSLVSLGESKVDRPMSYNYCLTIELVGQRFHRWLHADFWNEKDINYFVHTANTVGPLPANGWDGGLPLERMLFDMDKRGLPTSEHSTVLLEQKWMLEVVQKYKYVKAIGKRAKVSVSPNTYLFMSDTIHGVEMCTWMKYPTLEKFSYRAKCEPRRWTRSTPASLAECGLVFTREEIFAFHGAVDVVPSKSMHARVTEMRAPNVAMDDLYKKQRVANGLEREQPPSAAKALVEELCMECGCSLRTNLVFGNNIGGRNCGECELKAEVAQGTERTVQDSLVAARRKVYEKPVKQVSKFDPRPGIDTPGAWETPCWDDVS